MEEYSGGGRRGGEEDTAGMGRLYECVFCKRGFTTAQALGGHMNIHRKDRAKTNTNTSTTRPTRAAHELAAKNGGVSCPPAGHHLHGCYAAVAARGGWSLSLQVGPGPSLRVDDDDDGGNVCDHREDRRSFLGGEELDLELRLGHGRQ